MNAKKITFISLGIIIALGSVSFLGGSQQISNTRSQTIQETKELIDFRDKMVIDNEQLSDLNAKMKATKFQSEKDLDVLNKKVKSLQDISYNENLSTAKARAERNYLYIDHNILKNKIEEDNAKIRSYTQDIKNKEEEIKRINEEYLAIKKLNDSEKEIKKEIDINKKLENAKNIINDNIVNSEIVKTEVPEVKNNIEPVKEEQNKNSEIEKIASNNKTYGLIKEAPFRSKVIKSNEDNFKSKVIKEAY